jgi:hypothetical protein
MRVPPGLLSSLPVFSCPATVFCNLFGGEMRPVRQRDNQVRAFQVNHGREIIQVPESMSSSDDSFNLGITALTLGAVGTVPDSVQEVFPVTHYLFGQPDEGRYARVSCFLNKSDRAPLPPISHHSYGIYTSFQVFEPEKWHKNCL